MAATQVCFAKRCMKFTFRGFSGEMPHSLHRLEPKPTPFRRCPYADTQNALCASVADCRSSQNGHKTRADEPAVLGARDRSASVRGNCLPVIASAGTKADTFPSLPLPIQP